MFGLWGSVMKANILAAAAVSLGAIASAVALVALSASSVPAQAQAGRQRPAAHRCFPDATPLYSCRFGARSVSVCAQNGVLSYHYGRVGRANALTIPPGANGQNVHHGHVVGQGGGHQEHLRFTNNGTDYIIFRGVDGQLADRPGRSYTGLAVMNGRSTISTRSCARTDVNVPDWSPYLGTVAAEAEGSTFDGWF